MLRVSEGENRRPEGYLANYKQLRDSLLELQSAADRIFDRIEERTAKEHDKLMDLSNRVQKAKAKIDAISHSKEAIAIRSSPRYPSKSDREEDFHSLFGYRDSDTGSGLPVATLLVNAGLNREFGDGTLELFQFFSETSSDFLPKDAQPEVVSGVGHSSGNAFVESLLKPPDFTYGSILKEENIMTDHSSSPKHQTLPPPPPSLIHSSRVLPRSEGFNSRPSLIQHLKTKNVLADIPKVSSKPLGDPRRSVRPTSVGNSGFVTGKAGFSDLTSSPSSSSTPSNKVSDSGKLKDILAALRPKVYPSLSY
uniref:WASH1 WAHD domain-containing protein n=1 Tax=Nelumbo nucifera TaxID=4432 RepID=A0A822YDQ2_NELNU|nr:TPA_asm: hypothetical protein HUJ06_011135 [Nelumbo nucifera]